MSITPLSFPDFIDTTADEQRWQIFNAISSGGGGSGGDVTVVGSLPTGSNVIGGVTQGSPATPWNIQDHNSGINGGKVVAASTASGTDSWYAIQFVTSGTLTAYTGNLTGTVTGVTFPAGFVLYGNTTSFTTGSGTSVVAYTS
jgi:hypothetical protein